MEIILDHPYHGAMVAYSPAEAAEWEKKGWKKRPEKVKAPVEPAEVDAEVLTAPKKKWGRQ